MSFARTTDGKHLVFYTAPETTLEQIKALNAEVSVVGFHDKPTEEQLKALPESVSTVLLNDRYSIVLFWLGRPLTFLVYDNNTKQYEPYFQTQKNDELLSKKRPAEEPLQSDIIKKARSEETKVIIEADKALPTNNANPSYELNMTEDDWTMASLMGRIFVLEGQVTELQKNYNALVEVSNALVEQNNLLKSQFASHAAHDNKFRGQLIARLTLFATKIKALEEEKQNQQAPAPSSNQPTFTFHSNLKK